MRRARIGGARLALGIGERAHHLGFVFRRRAIGRDHGAGREAPGVDGERLGRRAVERRADAGAGRACDNDAASEQCAAVEQAVAGHGLRFLRPVLSLLACHEFLHRGGGGRRNIFATARCRVRAYSLRRSHPTAVKRRAPRGCWRGLVLRGGIGDRGDGCRHFRAAAVLSLIAMKEIGARLIYKRVPLRPDRPVPFPAQQRAFFGGTPWLGPPRRSSKSASASRSTAICRPSSDRPSLSDSVRWLIG